MKHFFVWLYFLQVKPKLSLILLFLFSIFSAHAHEDLITPSSSLENYLGQEIHIRGFLYQTDKNVWILASEPNLKSCCIGNNQKKPQIYLDKQFDSSLINQVVTLRGKINKHTEGALPTYLLVDVHQLVKIGNSIFIILLALILVFGVFFFLYKRTADAKKGKS